MSNFNLKMFCLAVSLFSPFVVLAQQADFSVGPYVGEGFIYYPTPGWREDRPDFRVPEIIDPSPLELQSHETTACKLCGINPDAPGCVVILRACSPKSSLGLIE